MSQVKMPRWPGESDEAFPEVFNKRPDFAKNQGKSGQLKNEDIDKFYRDGFLVVENFFTPEEIQEARDGVERLVDDLAQKLYKAGKVKDLYKNEGFHTRLIKLENDFPGANVILHKGGILPPGFRKLWSNDRLLNLVEQFVGPNIAGHPVWNLRPKTPKNEATTVPWHQDSAYMDTDSYGVFLFTAWVPLVDTDEVNGCMQMARGGHRSGKVAQHQCCAGPTWYVMLEEEEMCKTLGVDVEKDVVTCPVPAGGLLLFHNTTPHKSLNNLSDGTRWSLDLRWFDPSQPVGLWGLKDGVTMRTRDSGNVDIDWAGFEAVSRTEQQFRSIEAEELYDEFDTTISGPWMKQWELVNHNRHTESLLREEAAQTNTASSM